MCLWDCAKKSNTFFEGRPALSVSRPSLFSYLRTKIIDFDPVIPDLTPLIFDPDPGSVRRIGKFFIDNGIIL